jgi:hypothetical protein
MPVVGSGTGIGVGRLVALTFHPTDENIIFFGSESGALWRYDKLSNSSTLVSGTDQFEVAGIAEVVIDPSDPDRIFVGTGRQEGSYTSSTNAMYKRTGTSGIYRTENGGITWEHVLPWNQVLPNTSLWENSAQVGGIAINSNNPDEVIVFFRTNDADNPIEGHWGRAYKSTDGGDTFIELCFDDDGMGGCIDFPDEYFWDVEVHPNEPETIYLSSRRIYKSTDFGDTWSDETSKLTGLSFTGASESHIIQLAVGPEGTTLDDGVVIVTSDRNVNEIGLYISEDKMATISKIDVEAGRDPIGVKIGICNYNDKRHEVAVNYDFSKLYFAAIDYGWAEVDLVAETYRGFENSSDNLHDDVKVLAVPKYETDGITDNDGELYIGTDGGAYFMMNDGNGAQGIGFVEINDGMITTQFYSVSASERDEGVLGGTQDNATLYRDGLGNWQKLRGGDGADAFISLMNPNILYYGDILNNPNYNEDLLGISDVVRPDIDDCRLSVWPITESPHSSGLVFVGGQDDATAATFPFTESGTGGVSNYDFYFDRNDWNDILESLPPNIAPYENTCSRVTAIEFCESEPDKVFVASLGLWFRDDGSYWPSITGDLNGYNRWTLAVYDYSQPVGSRWSDITPHLGSDPGLLGVQGSPTDLAIDPDDGDKIWAIYNSPKINGAPPTYQTVIVKTTDGGATWTYDTTGLNSYHWGSAIEYQAGSNDVLFCATDRGVYRKEGSGNWECYKENLSTTMVTDIDISYCQGKIFAATYGHGMWASDLPAGNDYYKEITSTETWSSDRNVYGSVVVRAGGVLNLDNAEFNIAAGAKILVERGGRLNIDNATLTNLCGEKWEGIVVEGYESLAPPSQNDVLLGTYPSTGADHGVAFISNGAVIENANTGVCSGDCGSGTSFSGGIVYATNSTFKKNYLSALFTDYDYPSVSEFTGCTIESNLSSSQTILPAIKLRDIFDVNFNNCTFNSGGFIVQSSQSDVGIEAIDCTFDVLSTVSSTSFNNFIYGLRVLSTGKYYLDPLTVNGCTFTNNIRGALFSGFGNLQATDNTFEVPDAGTECYGIYLEGAFDYQIEDNYFELEGAWTQGYPYSTGVYVANGGSFSEQLYKNEFNSIEAGVRTQSDNSGLQIKCNEFVNIAKYNIAFTSGQLADQGDCSSSFDPNQMTAPAGNVFSDDCYQSNSDLFRYTGAAALLYHHHSDLGSNCADATLVDCFFNSDGTQCPSTPSGGALRIAGEDISLGDLEAQIDSLQQVIAKGDAQELFDKINDADVSATSVIADLLDASPYCSERIQKELISSESGRFSFTDCISILSANAPLSADVTSHLQVSSGMSSATIHGLGLQDSEVSPLDDINHEMFLLNHSRDRKYLDLIVELDSLNESDSLAALFENEQRPSLQIAYGLYLDGKDGSDYLTQDQRSRIDSELVEYLDFRLNMSTSSNVDSFIALLGPTWEKTTLRDIWASNLKEKTDESYEEEIFDSIPDLDTRYLPSVWEEPLPSRSRVYPNPSDGFIVVNIDAFDETSYEIEIYDILGNFISSSVSSNQATMVDTKGLTEGIYLVQIKTEFWQESHRLVVAH